MSVISDRLPGCRITEDSDDSLVVNWRELLAGARRRPNDGKWIVAVHDIMDAELDTAPAIQKVAPDRDAVADELCELVEQMLARRTNQLKRET